MDWSNTLTQLVTQGGWVMLPLGILSVVSVGLTLERVLFWVGTHRAGRSRTLARLTNELRRGDLSAAASIAGKDRSIYGRFAAELVDEARSRNGDREGARGGNRTGTPSERDPSHAGVQDSFALERAEARRPAIERWSTVHSVIITAAPMLGILGTVTGIIRSFNLLSAEQIVTDPAAVAGGIAEALFTTAVGLVVALLTLFPHAIFRSQADRALTRLELIAAAMNEHADD
jgi:biopolymer transport protein ExbB